VAETLYFDTCALNRLTDDQSQARVRDEALAVEHVLDMIVAGTVRWIASTAVHVELSDNPDHTKRSEMIPLLDFAAVQVEPTATMLHQVAVLQAQGLDTFDALHLAVCEELAVDSLLTVDDRFIRRASRRARPIVTEVLNPIDWLQRRQAWLPKP
jgi:predicted nucleic acid-binding protein